MTLACRDLRVHAGGRELLHVPGFGLPAGTVTAVLGPNGAGKSTLLRALGLLRPVTGTVLLDGTPATPAAVRAASAAVLQRPVLRRGTVAANAADGLRFRGVGRRAARARARPWLEALGVAHLADRDVRGLSGGEAQRVSLARALAVEPRVLLLDEPFTGLDAPTRADLLADLRSALDGRATATLLVTHDRAEAHALAERTALLVDGRIRAHGPTGRVLDEPVDAVTARLLGFTNLLPPALTGAPQVLAARPEDCRLADPDPGACPADEVRVPGTLRRAVGLGPVLRVDVDVTGGGLVCLLPAGTPVPAVGTAVDVLTARARRLPRPDPGPAG